MPTFPAVASSLPAGPEHPDACHDTRASARRHEASHLGHRGDCGGGLDRRIDRHRPVAAGLAKHVVGIGRREEVCARLARWGPARRPPSIFRSGLADAQLIIVCTPVGRISEDVCAAASFAKIGALITDVGSTKGMIVGELDRELPHESHFVGSHPLAGGEKAGPAAAVAGLFEGRNVVVTPGAMTRAEDVQTITAFWQSLGAKVLQMTPSEHDNWWPAPATCRIWSRRP